ncbi:hypothetical protein PIB30_031564 [Stylosanthes scabra]|uniref:Uncharacterized protein n=1 Tax=Stylosanthes scabra TaxID=79078 RepID=A0ABU6RCT5_9FABA|nr:hypothetical protein [Stylosanthes scabra]
MSLMLQRSFLPFFQTRHNSSPFQSHSSSNYTIHHLHHPPSSSSSLFTAGRHRHRGFFSLSPFSHSLSRPILCLLLEPTPPVTSAALRRRCLLPPSWLLLLLVVFKPSSTSRAFLSLPQQDRNNSNVSHFSSHLCSRRRPPDPPLCLHQHL